MAEDKDDRAGGSVLIDLVIRVLLLWPAAIFLDDNWLIAFALIAIALYLGFFAKRWIEAIILCIITGVLYWLYGDMLQGFPVTIYSLAEIISVDLLPLSAFSSLELAATWILWVFIALMFAGADWKGCIMMLAVGGVAMNFIAGLAIFAVADAEIAGTYADLTDNTGIKNETSSGIGNIWLMLSNPRLWYEQEYGYKNETMAQGRQTSPYALEITKATVLEKAAPPGSPVTFDVQVTNKGKRAATLKRIEVAVEDENLGTYHRYTKPDADIENAKNPDILHLYFESTPVLDAHYKFCDNPKIDNPEKTPSENFEPNMLDEYFFDVDSPECYGTQKLNATITYDYNVDATYNLELIDPDYYLELAKNRKLTFHTEDSTSSEGPLKLTIRSVPEEQPVRLPPSGDPNENEFTVFYSVSNIGPGTAVIKRPDDIYIERNANFRDISIIAANCAFNALPPASVDSTCPVGSTCKYLANNIYAEPPHDATKSFYTTLAKNDGGTETFPGITCTFKRKYDGGEKDICLTIPPNDLDKMAILKCTFKYEGNIDTTTTLFMKMHVDYSYITTKKAQYRTTTVPDSHSCVTKRALDGFPNKTGMDLYLKEVYSDVESQPTPFNMWTEDGLPSGEEGDPTDFC